MSVTIELLEGNDIEASSIEHQGEWIIAHVTGAQVDNYRAVPRTNIKQVVIAERDDWSRVSWEGHDE